MLQNNKPVVRLWTSYNLWPLNVILKVINSWSKKPGFSEFSNGLNKTITLL